MRKTPSYLLKIKALTILAFLFSIFNMPALSMDPTTCNLSGANHILSWLD